MWAETHPPYLRRILNHWPWGKVPPCSFYTRWGNSGPGWLHDVTRELQTDPGCWPQSAGSSKEVRNPWAWLLSSLHIVWPMLLLWMLYSHLPACLQSPLFALFSLGFWVCVGSAHMFMWHLRGIKKCWHFASAQLSPSFSVIFLAFLFLFFSPASSGPPPNCGALVLQGASALAPLLLCPGVPLTIVRAVLYYHYL